MTDARPLPAWDRRLLAGYVADREAEAARRDCPPPLAKRLRRGYVNRLANGRSLVAGA